MQVSLRSFRKEDNHVPHQVSNMDIECNTSSGKYNIWTLNAIHNAIHIHEKVLRASCSFTTLGTRCRDDDR